MAELISSNGPLPFHGISLGRKSRRRLLETCIGIGLVVGLVVLFAGPQAIGAQTLPFSDSPTPTVASRPVSAFSPVAVDPADRPQLYRQTVGAPASTSLRSERAQSSVPDIDPLAVTPAMASFLAERITPNMQRETRLRKLQEAIFDPEDGLGITYGTHGTFTAAETFDRATGNCLSFTLLFVSMARHLGFITHFVEVDEVTGWSQQGDVSFNHWHMFAEVEMANGVVQVDFLPWSERQYRARRRIEEPRMRAHFYNNVGAQQLTLHRADPMAAMAYFHKALDLDPTFTPARLNLAVAQRRAGDTKQAEANLLDILRQEPGSSQAATNLANLYSALGRTSEADRWVKKRDRFLKQNPFHHYRLGLRALKDDQPEQARVHFRRAIARQADEASFHQHLAEAYFRLGRFGKAGASLRRALDYTQDPKRIRAIEQALLKLERGSGGA